MIEVESAGLDNVVYFKSAHVALNKNPLTFIRGSNLDSDPATPTGNGTGKSLFFSALPTVAYASPPTSTKKKAKKEVLGKKSLFTIKLKNNNTRYEIRQAASKYTILKNGVDTEIRTVPLAEQEIREVIFPLTEIEYYSHGYVSTLRPYLITTDTDSNRLEHMSSIFRLDDYASMRSFFATKLRSVKDNEVRVAVLEQKALTLKDKIKRVAKLVSDASLSASRKEHKELEQVINVLVAKEFEELKTKQLLTTLLSIETELDTLRKQYKSKESPKAYLAWLKAQKALVKTWEEYDSLNSSYKRNTKSIQEKIDALKLPSRSKKVISAAKEKTDKLLEELEPMLEKLEEQFKAYQAVEKKLKPLASELAEFGDEVDEVQPKTDYASEIESLKLSLKLQKLLDHDHLEGNACPTCMSEVDLENIRKVVSKAKKRLPPLQRKFEIQQLLLKIKTLKGELREVKLDGKKLDETRLSVELCTGSNEEAEAELRIWKKHKDLNETLSDIKAPKKPDEKPDTKLSYDELDAEMEMCNAILQHVQSRTKLLENNPAIADCRTVKAVKVKNKEVEEKLEALGTKLEKARRRSAELSSTIEKQTNLQAEHSLYVEELSENQAEIKKIKPSSDDKKILEVLIKAYSSKGLKTIVANRICALLQSNLNLYRPLIFVEPFTFAIHASETGLAIRVDRGNGIESDVRNLSGAESNCFALLFLLSLLPLIPDARRLSMVTLDEPTAHCDDVTRRLFLDSYLPALCEVVPHVYVITNHPDDHMVGSNEWIIVKRKGVSSLITNQ